MSGFLDTTMSDLALKLIEKFGKDITFYSVAVSGDPITGDFTETKTASSQIISPPDPNKLKMVSGETYKIGDMSCLMSVKDSTVTPKINDEIDLDNTRYECYQVNPIYSGNLIAAHELILRAF